MTLLVHLLLALFIQITINWLGKYSYNFGYANISEITERSLGFNFLLRALVAPIFIILAALVFYQLNYSSIFLQDIWRVAFYYALINFGFAFFTGAFIAIPGRTFLIYALVHVSSVAISYWLYDNYIGLGANHLLPSAADFRSEIWLIVLIFLYQISNQIDLSNRSNGTHRLSAGFIRLYEELRSKYSEQLKPEIKRYMYFEVLLFSIAIYEHLNRNSFMRKVERLFFPVLKNKTTGLMQIASDKPLTDIESIELAQEKLLKRFGESKEILEEEEKIFLSFPGIRFLLRGYNTGNYAQNIYDVYKSLLLNLSPPLKTEERVAFLFSRAKFLDRNFEKLRAINTMIEALKLDPLNQKRFDEFLSYLENNSLTYLEDCAIDRLYLFREWISLQEHIDAKIRKSMDEKLDAVIFLFDMNSVSSCR